MLTHLRSLEVRSLTCGHDQVSGLPLVDLPGPGSPLRGVASILQGGRLGGAGEWRATPPTRRRGRGGFDGRYAYAVGHGHWRSYEHGLTWLGLTWYVERLDFQFCAI